jgi:hypothetical protein
MKPNEMDIDEILKRYLPRASQEEADAAGERVLKRIRALRFSHERTECKSDAKRKRDIAQPQEMAQPSINASKEPKAVRLTNKLSLAILAAVDELQGRGNPVAITLKAAELLDEMVSDAWVPTILRMMERMDLVTSSPDPNEPDARDKRSFQITASGRETLAAARAAAARRAAGPLEDFA